MPWIDGGSKLRGHPEAPGLYAFYFDGYLGYIGSSNSLGRRIYSHGMFWDGNEIVTKWGRFKSFRVKFRVILKQGDWLRREYILIKRLLPELNARHVRVCNGKFGPSLERLFSAKRRART